MDWRSDIQYPTLCPQHLPVGHGVWNLALQPTLESVTAVQAGTRRRALVFLVFLVCFAAIMATEFGQYECSSSQNGQYSGEAAR